MQRSRRDCVVVTSYSSVGPIRIPPKLAWLHSARLSISYRGSRLIYRVPNSDTDQSQSWKDVPYIADE